MATTRRLATLSIVLVLVATGGCEDPLLPQPGVTITAVNPSAGPPTGGTRVTITGTNFLDVTSVTIGGVELDSLTVLGNTEITGRTPGSSSSGASDVVVTTSSHGTATCRSCFTYDAPVAVTAVALAAGGDYTCALTDSGAAYCWGDYATPSRMAPDLSFSAIATGRGHTCGLTSSGSAYCWGQNSDGQLGDGSTDYSATPAAVSGGHTFIVLAAAGNYTCGLTGTGTAYCWGMNYTGQLGNGSRGTGQ